MVRLHIRPELRKVKLKNLTSAHVRGLYRQKKPPGPSDRPGGRPVARERSHLHLRERLAALPPVRDSASLKASAQAGLPEIRFHDLRHTCATLLLAKNVNPKVVSEMLGHASIAITLGTYSHVLPTMQESAANAMQDALS